VPAEALGGAGISGAAVSAETSGVTVELGIEAVSEVADKPIGAMGLVIIKEMCCLDQIHASGHVLGYRYRDL